MHLLECSPDQRGESGGQLPVEGLLHLQTLGSGPKEKRRREGCSYGATVTQARQL